MPQNRAGRFEIEDIFDEIRIDDTCNTSACAGWRRVPGRRGRPATDSLEVWVDAGPYHIEHDAALCGSSPGPTEALIASRLREMRGADALAALRTLGDARTVRVTRPGAVRDDPAAAASLVHGLHDVLLGSGTTHLLMPTGMHDAYTRSIMTLRRSGGGRAAGNAVAYRLGATRIVPSHLAERDSPCTAYAVDSASAMRFQGPVSSRRVAGAAGGPACIETCERYQFLLLSGENARTAPGAPYASSPGFRIEVAA